MCLLHPNHPWRGGEQRRVEGRMDGWSVLLLFPQSAHTALWEYRGAMIAGLQPNCLYPALCLRRVKLLLWERIDSRGLVCKSFFLLFSFVLFPLYNQSVDSAFDYNVRTSIWLQLTLQEGAKSKERRLKIFLFFWQKPKDSTFPNAFTNFHLFSTDLLMTYWWQMSLSVSSRKLWSFGIPVLPLENMVNTGDD